MKYSIDSRTIKPGETFIPVEGKNFSGYDFIEEVVNKGCRVLDVNLASYAASYRKKLKCRVIAVTGSAGKTTVKDLLGSVLSQKFKVVKTSENQNNEIGLPLSILKADSDTEILILELAMRHPGDISFLSKIARPDYVVVTGVGLTHIENFENQKDIARAKSEIFRSPLKWEKSKRTAFLNFSSDYYSLLKKKAEKVGYNVVPYSGASKIDQNMNLCYVLGRRLGLKNEDIDEGIKQYIPSEHRLRSESVNGVVIIDDSYNANPDGMLYAFEYMKRKSGRKIAVLGDMGELGKHALVEHQKVLEYAIDAGVSVMFTTGENMSAIDSKGFSVTHFKDKQAMHEVLLNELKVGDTVMIKGSRFMKMEETVAFLKENYGN
jgi:UDP-N-acetylmuramoyl-tripeptide--D-alanyl-D-alanine ligase